MSVTFVCFTSRASRPRQRVGDPAEGALSDGDLERPSGRRRHRLRNLAAGTALHHQAGSHQGLRVPVQPQPRALF